MSYFGDCPKIRIIYLEIHYTLNSILNLDRRSTAHSSSLGSDLDLRGATLDSATGSPKPTVLVSELRMYMQYPYARIEASENPRI